MIGGLVASMNAGMRIGKPQSRRNPAIFSIDRIPVTSNDIAKPTSEPPATCRDGHGMTLGFALHPIGSVRRNWLK